MTTTNRGATGLRTRRRDEDPMQAFDALPGPVRSWLSQAALPWSPASCRKILRKARARGEGLDDVLVRLDRAQENTLAHDRYAQSRITETNPLPNPQDTNT